MVKKNNNKWKTEAHIQFYALLLLFDMKWEVAYSTLCTEKKIFRNLYINLHMAGLHFHKLDVWHHSHTKTRKYPSTRQSDLRGVHDSSNITEQLDLLALESRLQPDICCQRHKH